MCRGQDQELRALGLLSLAWSHVSADTEPSPLPWKASVPPLNSVQCRGGWQGPLCCPSEILLEGIVFSRYSHALGSSCVLSVPMAESSNMPSSQVLKLGNSSCRCAWNFALMDLVSGRSFSVWWGPTRTSKVLELLDMFVNDMGKMGVNLAFVEDTKLLRQPSFLDCLQTCQSFL